MLKHLTLFCSLFFTFSLFGQSTYTLKGLDQPVEIIIDKWGIPHIYAQTQKDLFFAQGFNAAKDRLFQFEIWRRQANGTVAEILGPRELKRDIGTRLFLFRKDIEKEMNHYHDDGVEIITAYVAGVNAYIQQILKTPEKLPLEFHLLGIQPQLWTPEIVISRHQGLLGNIKQELDIARAVVLLGEEKVKEAVWFHPNEPDLKIDSKIKRQGLFENILELYNAYRTAVKFKPDDLIVSAQNDWKKYKDIALEMTDTGADDLSIGSNNWAITGAHTASGAPLLANDPHRTLAVPSLRYMAHLVAPGWNVIGGGEPEIPGISIGHNEHGAWGLTVFRSDAEDLYVYETNPKNPNQYLHQGKWTDFKIIKESILVKGSQAVEVDLKYSIHGPVCFEDEANNVAYAVRCGWLEYGGSPYLASLRMDQAKNFEEFRAACNYSNIPGENMVWADKAGNIGWQVVGINPIRSTHSGMVPVPGDGRYEWDRYIEIIDRPNVYNPTSGIIVTANNDVTPKTYQEHRAIGYLWSDPFRGNRVKEVLNSGRKHTMLDMTRLQSDYFSVPARQLAPLLKGLKIDNKEVQWAVEQLLDWDYMLEANSIEAAIYVSWERELKTKLWQMVVPNTARSYIRYVQVSKVIDWLNAPSTHYFGDQPMAGRDQLLIQCLADALANLEKRLGKDKTKWQYGQEEFKHVTMRHPLSAAVNDSLRQVLEVGPLPRGGNGLTVGSTGSADNQPSGGTFRVVIDTGDWDRALANNSPGQSGDPNHPHYKNLFANWAKDRYFPMFYSRKKVEQVVAEKIFLKPE